MGLSDGDANKYQALIKYTESVKIAPRAPIKRVAARHRQYQHYDRLDDGQVEQLVEGYLHGASTRTLASRFGCRPETVSKWLKSRGVKMRRPRLTDDQIEHARQLYESGLSLTDVGKLVHADRTAIRRHLLWIGVVMRDTQGRRK